MKKLGLVVFLSIFLFSLGLTGAALYSDGGDIYECGVINNSGMYELNRSFGFGGVGPCLVLFTGDVVIDGKGFILHQTGVNYTQGVFGSGFSNITVTNLTISNFSVGVNFTNVSEVSLTGVNATSCNNSVYLSISNALSLTVLDQDGNPLNASNVTIFNNVTNEYRSALTDANGAIPTQTLVDYVNENGTVTNMTYYATVVLDGYTNYSVQFNMASDLDKNVTLNDTVSPSLVLNSPSDGASFTGNPFTIDFNFSADDLSNFSCVLYIGGNNYTNFTVNGSEYLVSDSFVPGTYSWFVNCTDSANNTNASVTRTFTVSAPVVATTRGGGGGWAAPNVPAVVEEDLNNPEGDELTGGEGETEEEIQTGGFLTGGVIAPITGAAVGTLGETGTLILGLFATVLLIFAGVVVFKKAEWKKKSKKKVENKK